MKKIITNDPLANSPDLDVKSIDKLNAISPTSTTKGENDEPMCSSSHHHPLVDEVGTDSHARPSLNWPSTNQSPEHSNLSAGAAREINNSLLIESTNQTIIKALQESRTTMIRLLKLPSQSRSTS